jgi:hypothetical protein
MPGSVNLDSAVAGNVELTGGAVADSPDNGTAGNVILKGGSNTGTVTGDGGSVSLQGGTTVSGGRGRVLLGNADTSYIFYGIDTSDCPVHVMYLVDGEDQAFLVMDQNGKEFMFFDTDNEFISIPTSTVILGFGDENQGQIYHAGEGPFTITSKSNTAYTDILIQPGANTSGGGDSLYLYGGATSANSSSAGEVYIYAGAASGTSSIGGNVEIRGGQGSSGTGGNVNICAGAGATPAADGQVSIGWQRTTQVLYGASANGPTHLMYLKDNNAAAL